MNRRIQRASEIARDVRRVDAKPSASVAGRFEVVVDGINRRTDPRSAAASGAAVAQVYGGGVSEAPSWSGPNGPSSGPEQGSKRIELNQPRRTI